MINCSCEHNTGCVNLNPIHLKLLFRQYLSRLCSDTERERYILKYITVNLTFCSTKLILTAVRYFCQGILDDYNVRASNDSWSFILTYIFTASVKKQKQKPTVQIYLLAPRGWEGSRGDWECVNLRRPRSLSGGKSWVSRGSEGT